MRSTYWSNSAFADRLRKVFGLPDQPFAASFEEWSELEKLEKEISPFGIRLIDSLDSVQSLLYFIPDKTKSLIYFISNVKNRSNVLRTQTKLGHWGDLTSRIPDALMYAIIDFVEKECFYMDIAFVEKEKLSELEPEVRAYKEQSYLRRKLFGIEVSDEIRAKHARAWMDFQNENCGKDENPRPYDELWSAYLFAKNTYFSFDSYEESGYNELAKLDKAESVFSRKMSPDIKAALDKSHELEKSFDEQVEKYCTIVVKYHKHMWT